MFCALIALLCTSYFEQPVLVERSVPISYMIGGDRWTLGMVDDKRVSNTYAFVLKNGKRILKRDAYGGRACVLRCWFPTPWPVIAVGWSAGAGHGQGIEFYALQNGELRLLVSVSGECGGPIFRDFDGDGVMEWVFDDFEWYAHFDDPPMHFLVYRLNESGTLDLWRTYPNPDREILPTPFYDWF